MKFSKLFVAINLMAMIGIFGISGCDEEVEPTPTPEPEEEVEVANLEAVAIATPLELPVGEEVSLDASQSEDPDNVGYDIVWAFLSKPSNSASALTGGTQPTATFTPDEAGDYTIILKITNDEHSLSDADTITVTATAPQFIVIDQDITADRVLENLNEEAELKDYLVTGWIDISAKLTVMPGVRIHFAENTGFNVKGDGVFVADGEESTPIVFTGEGEVNGYWRGINIWSNSVENSISHAEISYAGSQEAGSYFRKAALTIDNAKINLDQLSITNSGQYGIQTRRNGSSFPMSSISFAENDGHHLYIHASQMQYLDANSAFDNGYVEVYSGSTEDEQTIHALNGAKYLVSSSIEMDSRVTIAEGAEFEFGTDVRMKVSGNGVLIAEGSEENRIVFTGEAKAPGAWRGIYFTSSSVDNIMNHVEISYAGSSEAATYHGKGALTIDNAKINLQNMLIANTDGYGIQTRRTGSRFPMQNITFTDNANSHMYIHPDQIQYIDSESNFNGGYAEVFRGNTETSGSETWASLNNGMYLISGLLDIERTVTIEPGAVFESASDVKIRVWGTEGEIIAVGTAENPIVFTGKSKTKGAWGGLLVSTGSVENRMDHVEISYGGGTTLATYMDAGNLGVHNESRLILSNARITNSAGYGIIVREGRKAILSSSNIEYEANTLADLYVY